MYPPAQLQPPALPLQPPPAPEATELIYVDTPEVRALGTRRQQGGTGAGGGPSRELAAGRVSQHDNAAGPRPLSSRAIFEELSLKSYL